jgi:hypothetical protein
MTSILTETQAMTRYNGTFVVITGTTNAIASTFSNSSAIGASGFLNAAGSVYNYSTVSDATTAIGDSFATGATVVVGTLYQDKGNRIVFSAQGQTVAIFAEVLPLTNLSTEGGETTFYICLWSANPGTSECVVRVARI